jgi:predicted enzyme related to lactoylglutathione lyase
MANPIVWCDIPVVDLERAIRFYSAVLGSQVKQEQFPGMTIRILPHNNEELGACLVNSTDGKPGGQGRCRNHLLSGSQVFGVKSLIASSGKPRILRGMFKSWAPTSAGDR